MTLGIYQAMWPQQSKVFVSKYMREQHDMVGDLSFACSTLFGVSSLQHQKKNILKKTNLLNIFKYILSCSAIEYTDLDINFQHVITECPYDIHRGL